MISLFLVDGYELLSFYLPKNKVTKEKCTSAICPLRGFPVLLAFIGARPNALRSNKGELLPIKAAMLGGLEEDRKSQYPDFVGRALPAMNCPHLLSQYRQQFRPDILQHFRLTFGGGVQIIGLHPLAFFGDAFQQKR